jgi:hypothetical protein
MPRYAASDAADLSCQLRLCALRHPFGSCRAGRRLSAHHQLGHPAAAALRLYAPLPAGRGRRARRHRHRCCG